MEILGIGPSELVLIVVLALIILGPRDMQRAGHTLGRWLRQVVTSDGWKFFQQTSREIQTLPNRLMREAALEDLQEIEQSIRPPLHDVDGQPSQSVSAPVTAPAPDSQSDSPPHTLPSPPADPPRTDSGKNA